MLFKIQKDYLWYYNIDLEEIWEKFYNIKKNLVNKEQEFMHVKFY